MLNEQNSDSQAETDMAPSGPDLGTAPNLRGIINTLTIIDLSRYDCF